MAIKTVFRPQYHAVGDKQAQKRLIDAKVLNVASFGLRDAPKPCKIVNWHDVLCRDPSKADPNDCLVQIHVPEVQDGFHARNFLYHQMLLSSKLILRLMPLSFLGPYCMTYFCSFKYEGKLRLLASVSKEITEELFKSDLEQFAKCWQDFVVLSKNYRTPFYLINQNQNEVYYE